MTGKQSRGKSLFPTTCGSANTTPRAGGTDALILGKSQEGDKRTFFSVPFYISGLLPPTILCRECQSCIFRFLYTIYKKINVRL